MPLARIVEQKSANYTNLHSQLLTEWQAPSDAVTAPFIIEENDPIRPQQLPQHLYVIWDAWASLSQQERSRIILSVYGQIKGVAAARAVTVAMGLTKDEADRLHIEYEAVPS